jgi:hypothetical protein
MIELLAAITLVLVTIVVVTVGFSRSVVMMATERRDHQCQINHLLRELETQRESAIRPWLEANRLIATCKADDAIRIAQTAQRLLDARAQIAKGEQASRNQPLPDTPEGMMDALDRSTRGGRSALPTRPTSRPRAESQ